MDDYAETYLDVYSNKDGALISDMKLYGRENDVLHGLHEVAHAAAVEATPWTWCTPAP